MTGEDRSPKPRRGLGFQPSLKGRALRLLSQREHSRLELERKLRPFEEVPGELAAALDFLQAKDFINENRVVESVVNRRASKLGASRIKQELTARGLGLGRRISFAKPLVPAPVQLFGVGP